MNTKKLKPPKNRMSETVVELNTDFDTALWRLRQMNGPSLETDSIGQTLWFASNQKGRFTITQVRNSRYEAAVRSVALRGGLYVEDGKTKTVLYTYRLGGTVFGMIMEIIAGLVGLLYVLFVGAALLEREFSAGTVAVCGLLVIIAIAIPIHGIIRLEKGKQGGEGDAQKMLEDALRRLNAVNDWDK